jgi:P-type conjugative transfer protein TrbJ
MSKGSKMKKLILLSAIAIGSLQIQAGPVPNIAGGFSTEATQILNNAQLVLQYAKQIEQYRKQVEQYVLQYETYRAMLVNIRKLPETQWRQFENTVLKLKGVIDGSSKVTYVAGGSFGLTI